MDAVLLTLVLVGSWFGRFVAERSWSYSFSRGIGYLAGATAVAAALALLFSSPTVEAEAGLDTSRLPVATGADSATGMPGSRRVAQQTSQDGVQSFLAVEPFEIRHEVLVRLRDVAAEMGVEGGGTLEIHDQPDIKERLQEMVLVRLLLVLY